MQEKIENFRKMTLIKQKEIILIVLNKSKEKSEGLRKLYNVVNSIDISIELTTIKEEFLKIYTFLMEAVDYIKSQKLNESLKVLNKVKETLDKMKEEEKLERESEDIDSILELELANL